MGDLGVVDLGLDPLRGSRVVGLWRAGGCC
jgi:hypothetical protein